MFRCRVSRAQESCRINVTRLVLRRLTIKENNVMGRSRFELGTSRVCSAACHAVEVLEPRAYLTAAAVNSPAASLGAARDVGWARLLRPHERHA